MEVLNILKFKFQKEVSMQWNEINPLSIKNVNVKCRNAPPKNNTSKTFTERHIPHTKLIQCNEKYSAILNAKLYIDLIFRQYFI